jgi:eukaryotic-like serine/threonine-protein kinase
VQAVSAETTRPVGPGVELRDGRYRLERVLGIGGMASVWLGHDQRLDRPVAVKVLSDTLASDASYVERFRREARIAARLTHPNLVKVFDFEANGRPALIMEYVECGTLAETANRPDSAVEVEALAVQLLGALEHIHAAGIVHRDVKPANILIAGDRRALLTDFGIAQPDDGTRLTNTGQVIGTLAYMAPEIQDGDRATAQSDLYSCGVVLRDHLTPDSPATLRQLVERLIERDPRLRPQSAKRALAYLAGSVPTGAAAARRAAVTTQGMPAVAGPDTEEIEPAAAPEPDRPPFGGDEVAVRGQPIRARHVLALLAVLAVVVGVVVIASGGGDDDSSKPPSQEPETAAAGEPAAVPAAASDVDAIPAPKDDADPAQGAALNDEGFALMQSGDYDGAVKSLRKALAQFPDEARTPEAFATDHSYAYALFNYGRALRLGGHPDEAIPVLRARLEIPDQTETVQAELDQAKADVTGASPVEGDED